MTDILLFTIGTGGDVYPFVEIGRVLRTRGYRVELVSNGCYAPLAAQAGLDFAAVDTAEAAQHFLQDLSLMHSFQGQADFFRQHTLPRMAVGYQLIQDRYRPGKTLLVTQHLMGLAAQLAAEKLGLPVVRIFTAVAQMTGLPMLEAFCRMTLAKDINHLRAAFDLPPVSDWRAWVRYARCNLGLWPEWFADHEPGVVPVGFVVNTEAETGPVPAEAQAFLEVGEPPLLITGGTGAFIKSDFYTAGIEACRLLGWRGMVQTPYASLAPSLPEGVKWFSTLPFAEIMPRVRAIIHHAGTGTLSRALLAGLPQLALPAGTDRPDTAARLQRLGVAESLPSTQWQPRLLAEALQRLTQSPEVRARCRELALKLKQMDAAAIAGDVIEAFMRSEAAAGKENSAFTQSRSESAVSV